MVDWPLVPSDRFLMEAMWTRFHPATDGSP